MTRPSFRGYPRLDGTFGARNHVGVIPSVTCAGDVAQAICRQVAGTVCYLHHQGCCQLPPDLDRVTETLISLGKSPNVGAVLIVSLGCEGTDHERMYEELLRTGKPVRRIAIQELGGTAPAIARGIEEARELVLAISGQQRVEADISNAMMAIKCGASDTTSGMASNCVIGRVADRLVDLGATVIFGETTEFIGGEDLLARRAATSEVARRIYQIVDARYNAMLPVIVTSQYPPQSIERRLARGGEVETAAAIASRLAEMCEPVPLTHRDRRRCG